MRAWRPGRFGNLFAWLVPLAAACVTGAAAAPPGKWWTPNAGLSLPGFSRLTGSVMDADSNGVPLLFAQPIDGKDQDLVGFRWADSAWVLQWTNQAADPGNLWPVPTSSNYRHLIWLNGAVELDPYFPLMISTTDGASLLDEDTVTTVFGFAYEYAAAVGPKSRWAVLSDPIQGGLDLRLFYSHESGPWGEISLEGRGGDGVAVAALHDTTALVAWADGGAGPLRWGTAEGGAFTERTPPLRDNSTNRPRFRPRPSGGHWLAWGSLDPFLEIATYRDGAWTAPESLHCSFLQPRSGSTTPDLSRDGGEYPAVVWGAFDNVSAGVCICVPNDAGFTQAEEIQSGGTDGPPTVARDKNGDVWVTWSRYSVGVLWTHSYTKATASTPAIDGDTGHCRLTWTLSEPAPETWWAVMRAPEGLEFEAVARVRAGAGIEMSWTDPAPPSGLTHYRIRRESVDKRYEWLSEEVICDAAVSVQVSLQSATAEPHLVLLRWQGAGAGALGAQVERRGESTGWQTLAPAVADGLDRLLYEDGSVTPGARYAYRLSYLEQGVQRYTAETWVDVPNAFELALEGFRPNPASRGAQVAFTLPESGSAVLEVIDIAGRKVFGRKVGALGPGRHVVSLEDGVNLAPGVYLIRLTHGSRVVQARGVVMR